MLKPEGYSVITEPGKRDVEHDTLTCGHCGAISFTSAGVNQPPQIVVVKWDQTVKVTSVERCFKCWRFICPICQNKPFECVPLEKKIELEEKAARLILP